MLSKVFDTSVFVASHNVPSIIAYDPKTGKLVIGDQAKKLASPHKPLVQDFKQSIGETDAFFDGKYVSSKGAKAQRLWEIRTDGLEAQRYLSTREATKKFLESFFDEIEGLPGQLIIGVPADRNKAWSNLYRAHINSILRELGYPDAQFFPEPFAVFQYYRHVEKLIPESSQPLSVLVIDFGGGTLNSCVIETTREGNLSRGGTTALPLGIQSFVGAGKEIDRRLLKAAVAKQIDPRHRRDSVDARIESRPWALLAIEDIKILLSKKMFDAKLDQNYAHISEKTTLPPGTYHPDLPVEVELNGEDLKGVLKELWYEKSGPGSSIVSTISEAKFRGGGVQLQQLDKVILAGGSSNLPFLRELLISTLSGQVLVRPEDVVLGKNSEKAVAYGIAIEAAEDRNKALRTHNAVGPCVFNELYLFSAPRRREKAIRPKIRFWEKKNNTEQVPGTLLAGPMQVSDFKLDYQVELPFRPHGSLFYWFSSSPDPDSPEYERLNIEQDVLHLPPKSEGRFQLTIEFDSERGLISPYFTFGTERLKGAPFSFGGLNLKKDVRSYVGIDFGTSNSYGVTMWAATKERESKYPEFQISDTVGEKLREVETLISKARYAGTLTKEKALELSRKEQASFVFHSVKIEGNSLSRGETEALLDGKKPVQSKQMQEPVNVRDAYEFCMENAAYLINTPEGFIRELHKMVLRNISQEGGEYRKNPVSIAGMIYTPPDWVDVEPFMTRFATELRSRNKSKSVIQYAAEAHSAFTSIHPFADGNGRTARLIMNAILMEDGLPAVIIAHSDKARYLDALASSNKGDISDFCVLIAESLESSLATLGQQNDGEDVGDIFGVEEKPVVGWVPSEELAAIMKSRIDKAPLLRRDRYEAWAAAFESLREEFQVTCSGFNETYSETLYHANLTKFDKLPFEKWEELLRNKKVPRTWSLGMQIGYDLTSEQFIFWYRHMSPEFQHICKESHSDAAVPPAEVSLTVSRKIEGAFQPLMDEPIRLRELAYVGGRWMAMVCGKNNNLEAQIVSIPEVSETFLRDAINAFL